jgi:arylsulfatase A-like enzyme
MRFLQGYANSAVCSATRVALITGRYQYRLRLGLEEPLRGNPDVGLPPEHPTLPSLLKTARYSTTLIGKWHLGALPKFGPLKSGYDHFFGFRAAAVDYFSHINPAQRHDLWDQDVEVHQVGYLTDQLGSRAVNAVNSYAKSGQPFLISLHFNAPHWPWEGPDDEAESKRIAGSNLRHFDGGNNGLTENTIVIFTSDNGGERFADTWPFTGKKTDLLEGGLRIPMLIAWPAQIPPGRTSDQVAISMDWLPTLLAAAGIAPDSGYPPDGINLLPALTENAATVERKLFWRYKGKWQRAARIGDHKFLKILDNTFLFNVVEDPLERANLRERHKDVYDRIVAEWNAWNASMLPEIAESFSHSLTGEELADHYGAKEPSGAPDPTLPLPLAVQSR